MRRKEKEIKDKTEIEKIIKKAEIMHLGMCDGNQPYVIPINFGYKDNIFYFHCAKEGRKLEILNKNPLVCIQISDDFSIIPDEKGKACEWGAKFKSIIAEGKAEIIEDLSEKTKALDLIMNQYSDENFTYGENAIKGVTVVKIIITKLTGKQTAD